MAIIVNCDCGWFSEVDEKSAGTEITCPKCETVLTVPPESEEPTVVEVKTLTLAEKMRRKARIRFLIICGIIFICIGIGVLIFLKIEADKKALECVDSGIAAMAEGKLDDAQELADKARDLNDGAPGLNKLAGEIARRKDVIARKKKALSFLAQGTVALDEKKYVNAARFLDMAYKNAPDLPGLKELLIDLKQRKKAVVLVSRGRAAMNSEKYEAAYKFLSQARELYGKTPGLSELADDLGAKAGDIQKKVGSVILAGRNALVSGEFDKAKEYLKQAQSLDADAFGLREFKKDIEKRAAALDKSKTDGTRGPARALLKKAQALELDHIQKQKLLQAAGLDASAQKAFEEKDFAKANDDWELCKELCYQLVFPAGGGKYWWIVDSVDLGSQFVKHGDIQLAPMRDVEYDGELISVRVRYSGENPPQGMFVCVSSLEIESGAGAIKFVSSLVARPVGWKKNEKEITVQFSGPGIFKGTATGKCRIYLYLIRYDGQTKKLPEEPTIESPSIILRVNAEIKG